MSSDTKTFSNLKEERVFPSRRGKIVCAAKTLFTKPGGILYLAQKP